MQIKPRIVKQLELDPTIQAYYVALYTALTDENHPLLGRNASFQAQMLPTEMPAS